MRDWSVSIDTLCFLLCLKINGYRMEFLMKFKLFDLNRDGLGGEKGEDTTPNIV